MYRTDFTWIARVASIRGNCFLYWYPTNGMKMSGFIGNIKQKGKWVEL